MANTRAKTRTKGTATHQTLLSEIREADPSNLTTAALLREISNLEKNFNSQINGIQEGIKTAHEDATQVPTEIDKRVGNSDEMTKVKIGYEHQIAKLEAIHIRVELGHLKEKLEWHEKVRLEQKADSERRIQENKSAGDVSLAAALTANKELNATINNYNNLATTKQETFYNKQMDLMASKFDTTISGLKDSFSDMKNVITQIIAGGVGKEKQEDKSGANLKSTIAIIISVAILVMIMYNSFKPLIGK